MEPKKEHILFIINPLSGGKNKRKIPSQIALFFKDKPSFAYEIIFTEYKNHAAEIARENIHKGFSVIVAVGGDGTINEVGKALLHSGIALGIIPLGSGNGFAYSLGYKKLNNINDYLNIICRKKIIQIDTAEINRRAFLNIAGLGFDAFIARKFAKQKRRGLINYMRLTLLSFFRFPSFSVSFRGKTYDNILFVSFSNGNQFGNDFVVTPQSDMQDGKIEISIAFKPKIREIPAFVLSLYRGNFPSTHFTEQYSNGEFTLEGNSPQDFHIDGEYAGTAKIFQAKIVPRSLNVVAFPGKH